MNDTDTNSTDVLENQNGKWWIWRKFYPRLKLPIDVGQWADVATSLDDCDRHFIGLALQYVDQLVTLGFGRENGGDVSWKEQQEWKNKLDFPAFWGVCLQTQR